MGGQRMDLRVSIGTNCRPLWTL